MNRRSFLTSLLFAPAAIAFPRLWRQSPELLPVRPLMPEVQHTLIDPGYNHHATEEAWTVMEGWHKQPYPIFVLPDNRGRTRMWYKHALPDSSDYYTQDPYWSPNGPKHDA